MKKKRSKRLLGAQTAACNVVFAQNRAIYIGRVHNGGQF
jgi:hypothetical protein